MSAAKVTKAVLPVAGIGTRFLPATKAQPKEMLPLVDKPLIQYAVEEAVASGIEDIILVTGHGKDSIEEHFDAAPALIQFLEGRGKKAEADIIRQLGEMANVISVRQKEPLGLGHAVGCARELVGGEPFVVMLPDDVIDAEVPCVRQLLDAREAASGGCVIATRAVDGPAIERYGVMAVEPAGVEGYGENLHRVTGMVEKPKAADAPSPYVVIGRYVLEPEVFDSIAATKPGRGGEIQLTDALVEIAGKGKMHALVFDGVHNDAGDKLGFLKATVHYGLQHPELGDDFRDYLASRKH